MCVKKESQSVGETTTKYIEESIPSVPKQGITFKDEMKARVDFGTSPFYKFDKNNDEEVKEPEQAAEIRARVYAFGEFSFST